MPIPEARLTPHIIKIPNPIPDKNEITENTIVTVST